MTRRGLVALCAWWVGIPAAHAQEGAFDGGWHIDVHGRVARPGDGSPNEGLLVGSVRLPDAWAVGGLAHLAVRPVVGVRDGAIVTPIVNQLVGVDLQGVKRFGRVGVAASLPLFPYGSVWQEDGLAGRGPRLGDLHVWAPIALVRSEEGAALDLALMPWARLPTSRAAWVGDANPSVGGAVIGAGAVGPVAWGFEGGVFARGWQELAYAPGYAVVARVGGRVGVLVGEHVGVHLEAALDAPLTGNAAVPEAARGALAPGEQLLSVRWRGSSGVSISGGAGFGLTRGLGAPDWRAQAGLGYAPPKASAGPAPEAGAKTVAFVVVDAVGLPVRGAEVRAADALIGVTDAQGALSVAAVAWRRGVRVSAPGFVDEAVAAPSGPGPVQVALDWAPVALEVVVKDEQGRAPPAVVSIRGPSGENALATPGPGDPWSTRLLPGDWTLVVDAPGFGDQVRGLTIAPRRVVPVRLEVILLPDAGDGVIGVAVSDPDGAGVAGARVLVDGRPIGDAGTDGSVQIGDLAPTPHRVEVAAEGFRTQESRDVAPAVGVTTPIGFALDRLPGSVKVIARTDRGRVVDAVARFVGTPREAGVAQPAVRLPAADLGDAGERVFVLRPGDWTVLVASETYGLQQRSIVVPDGDTSLTVVEVVLQPAETGAGTLRLTVVDPDGAPIDGIDVRLDDRAVGRTSTGGSLELVGLSDGLRRVELSGGPAFRPTTPAEVVIAPGLQERVIALDYVPGVVRVRARTPERPVGDATARFSGAAAVPPMPLGSDGVADTRLDTGPWQVVVASPAYGLQQRGIAVDPDERRRIDVDVVMSAAEDGPATLDLRLTDPDARPVRGADVRLDGDSVGRTSNAGVVTLPGLDAGPRTLEVYAKAFDPVKKTVTLGRGELDVDLGLTWGPGAVRVVVTQGGAPVTQGVVRVAGPGVMAPQPLDERGERLFELVPGTWQVVVVSPTAGMAQREVTITGKEPDLVEVAFALDAPDAGEAELLVRVQDPDGQPVPGATVRLAGAERGQTSAGGSLLLGSLAPGDAVLDVIAAGFVPARGAAMTLAAGAQERIVRLDWVPVAVDVSVTDAAGAPVDAEVRFDGPADVAPVQVGPDGRAEVELRPGRWSVLASAPALGARRAEATVVPGGTLQRVALTLSAAKVDVTAGSVVIKEQVNFDFDRAVLRPDSAAVLDEVAAALLGHPEIARVEIQGHTDNKGDLAYNLALSASRAEAVRVALAARGVAPERLVARGFGATRPIAGNDDDAGRAKNRRVQFEIVERTK